MTIVHAFSCSGPSQEFGWAGHGSYAPLGIPNIFKVAGIDTKWDPETNEFADDTGDPAWLTREYRAPYSFG